LVNSSVAIYSKTGSLLSTQSFANFFAPVNPGPNSDLFDPQVFYDEGSGRFILGVDGMDTTLKTSYYLLAVSNDSDATHGFTEMHNFSIKETIGRKAYWGDFPRVGYNADAVVVTFNMFSFARGSFGGVQMVSIAKSTLLDANNNTFTKFVTNF